jgi:hypothetical protein
MKHVAQLRLHECVGDSPNAVMPAEDRAHLLTCPQCARELKELQGVWDALGSWQVGTSADLTQRIVQAAQQRGIVPKRQRWGRPATWTWPRRAAAIAASIAVGMTAGFLSGRLPARPCPVPPAAVVSAEGSAVAAANLEVLNAPSVGLANCVALRDGDNAENAR